MTLQQIKTSTTAELIIGGDEAKGKAELNSIIYELACRTYIPFSGINFDDLLIQYGYQLTEKEKSAQEGKNQKLNKGVQSVKETGQTKKMGRWQSGQLQETVNLLTAVYGGSIPSTPTISNLIKMAHYSS